MITSPNNKHSPLDFIKAVAKYFMDFLETDFHRRRNPKRNIQIKNPDNLLIGLNLSKYPAFNKVIWKYINNNFDKKVIEKIEKGVYKTNLPQNLIDVIKLQVENIKQGDIKKIVVDLSLEIKKATTLHNKNLNLALNTSLEKAAVLIKNYLLQDFLTKLKEPLETLELSDENNFYLMEEELTTILTKLLQDKITEIVKSLQVKNKINVEKEIKESFELTNIKQCINVFFEDYKVMDLYSELYEMDRNKSILDKQEFYLYFCDITYNKTKYPFFYIPFEIGKGDNFFTIEFDSQLYINKRALEYITQEYNLQKDKKGKLKTIGERIIYINQEKEKLANRLLSILNEVINVFELNNNIDLLNPEKQYAKGALVQISNSSYIALFDKSDEALVNDYEEILKLLEAGDSLLANTFNQLIEDFINKNPNVLNLDIGEEWDELETPDKLVFNSPIPMNSEQLQLLQAIRRDDCKYIVVEGPPGTGKSHTITAIAFDSILKNHSVLVLSDKKEALDVVEDKITDTLNKVRFDKNFQNPLLRLGRAGSTYNQILATNSVDNIVTNYKAVKKDYTQLQDCMGKIANSLKDDIQAEIFAYKEININEIHDFINIKNYINDKIKKINIDELITNQESIVEIDEIRKIYINFIKKLESEDKNVIWEYLSLFVKDGAKLTYFKNVVKNINIIVNSATEAFKQISIDLNFLYKLASFNNEVHLYLNNLLLKYQKLHFPIVGYLFTKKQVNLLDLEFKNKFPHSQISDLHNHLNKIQKILSYFSLMNNLKSDVDSTFLENLDYFELIYKLLEAKDINALSTESLNCVNDIDYLIKTLSKYPETFKEFKYDSSPLMDLSKNSIIGLTDYDFDKLLKYIYLYHKIIKNFKNIPLFDYESQKNEIEKLVTTKMTYLMDSRLIHFYENNKATAKALRQIIKNKQQFPREEFDKLKEAFPCILASIRDYAEYIPLQPEIFDLVIIDEASQVSIAQAFPALLRAKKVLILGDKKQFSNVKSIQARTDTNREYTNNLKDIFLKVISDNSTKLVKLEKFNIKTSILDFFEFISNFNIQLLKHFRGYKEIISYSNKYFYQDSLQVMKIRGRSINEILKFDVIKHDGKIESIPNTNTPEVEFIISQLLKLKESESKMSVGIITPHTNQQKLLVERVNKLPERDYFYDNLKLKIMTFDTCQGEERDVIFYSMVASEQDDKLWGIFIKDLSSVDIEEDGKIKAQRLNVGFSRAKETMHFVLSKPLDKFNGSIGEALNHYKFIYDEAKKEKDPKTVDPNSKMESEVLNWFYQTEFWKTHKDNIEFQPQFELGAYLKQLDKTYTHPNYKVDFLITFNDVTHKIYKIIMEYDGFFEHFNGNENVTQYNYQEYYSEDDVYREKVLESYGYKFLRINKFNIGKNPIQKLNDRIYALIRSGNMRQNGLLEHIHTTVESLQKGDIKECPKCREIRNLDDFRDSDLISGYGRFCKYCKNLETPEEYNTTQINNNLCPKCNSKMVLRSGRYGRFYGCSRYPYCKGTRIFS